MQGQHRRHWPSIEQNCVFVMDNRHFKMLQFPIKITVAIPFKHKTQCCLNVWAGVADSDTTLSQQGDKSMCVLGTLNTI